MNSTLFNATVANRDRLSIDSATMARLSVLCATSTLDDSLKHDITQAFVDVQNARDAVQRLLEVLSA